MLLIVALLVVGVIVYRVLTADERKKAAGRALELTQQLRAARANIRSGSRLWASRVMFLMS